jgi:hypothetical protein
MARRIAIPKWLRFYILWRDNFRCQYCGRGAPDVVLHVDHKISVYDGGTNDPDNLFTACVECNAGKATRSVRFREIARYIANDNEQDFEPWLPFEDDFFNEPDAEEICEPDFSLYVQAVHQSYDPESVDAYAYLVARKAVLTVNPWLDPESLSEITDTALAMAREG